MKKNKILNFEEYINERLFDKSINRIKSGEKRLEDKKIINEYLKTVKWVDMGNPKYLFAKNDIQEDISLAQIIEFINSKPDDITFMDKGILSFLNKTCENYYYKSEDIDVYENLETKNKINFFISSSYFIRILLNDDKFINVETLLSRSNYISVKDLEKPQFRFKLLKKK